MSEVVPNPAPFDALIDDIVDAVLDCDAPRAVQLARAAIAMHVPVEQVLADGLAGGLREAADMYRRQEVYLVDMFNAARTVDEALVDLAAEIADARASLPHRGTVVVGVIAPNIQDMGKRLLAIMLRAHGHDVVDLGANVPPEVFIQAARDHGAAALAVTVMTNDGIPQLERLLVGRRAQADLNGLLVLCGGAAITPGIAEALGARYGRDAAQAIGIIGEHADAQG